MKYIYLLKLCLIFFIVASFTFSAAAQSLSTNAAKVDSLRKDSLKKVRAEGIFIEVGGAGLAPSLNYDTRFKKRRDGLGFRVGAGYLQYGQNRLFGPSDPNSLSSSQVRFFTVPVQLNYLLGKSNHFAEFGAGTTYTMFNGGGVMSNDLFPGAKPENQFKLINTLTLGYRFQQLTGGVTFRVNADIFYTAIYFVPTGGFSLGYTFKDRRFKKKKTESNASKLKTDQPANKVVAVNQMQQITPAKDNVADTLATKAATDTAKGKIKTWKSVYAEFLGPGLLLSANYDTRFSGKRDGWGGRIGLGFVALEDRRMISFPVQINYLLGKGSDFFEIGLGASYLKVDYTDVTYHLSPPKYMGFGPGSILIGTSTFGYRHQPADGGVSFRVSLNPLFNDKLFAPSGAVSFGYLFK